jgi:hypothetical protein
MKNLMIYISPTGSFNNPTPLATNDGKVLVKVQIDNSLELGWKVEDILLVTNFDFQYRSVKAAVFKDIEYFEPYPKASKINAIIKLFEEGLINDRELYWFHDLDAFELTPIKESEVRNQIELADLGLSAYDDYNLSPAEIKNKKWNTGSMFLKSSAKDIFSIIRDIMYDHEPQEEKALTEITTNDSKIRKRIKQLDDTYNFVAPLAFYYGMAHKPSRSIKVLHYHPASNLQKDKYNSKMIPVSIVQHPSEGNHPLERYNIKLIPERLEKVFIPHGILYN